MSPSTRSSTANAKPVANRTRSTSGMVSPYFSGGKNRRKTAATAVACLAAAVVGTSPVKGFVVSSPRTPRRRASPRKPVSTSTIAIHVTPASNKRSPNKKAPSSTTSETTTTTSKNKEAAAQSPASNQNNKKKKSPTKSAPQTDSFEPVWSKQFHTPPVPVHTLLLGTHPSPKSFEEEQYYGHPRNAFWWIAGDCLGFRRAKGLKVDGTYYDLTKDLRYPEDKIVPYPEQVKILTQHGFALWDVVASCERQGALDHDIRQETPNKIREFCHDHPSLQRIVFCSGGTTCTLFRKHFREWLESGELQALPGHKASENAFAKAIDRGETKRSKQKKNGVSIIDNNTSNMKKISLICPLSVSSAAAKHTYKEKRDFWDEYVYQPGLLHHKAYLNILQKSRNEVE